MVRRYLPFMALAMLLVFAGPSRLAPAPGPRGVWIQITATAVTLDPQDSAHRRVGELTFLRGWELTSTSTEFGGLSALRPWHGRWLAVLDTGALLSFTPKERGAVIVPLNPRCNFNRLRLGRDIEGLDTDGVRIWVSSEWRNAICRRDPDGMQTGVQPPEMLDWPRYSGPETLLRLRDGRFLVMPENPDYPALLFPRDPVGGAKPRKLSYRPPAGYRPTDAAQLPDGRIIILNRSIGWRGFGTTLTLFDGIPTHGTAQGRTIATIARPLSHDNFEGISARREAGATILTLVSDNNNSWFQETLLFEFRLEN